MSSKEKPKVDNRKHSNRRAVAKTDGRKPKPRMLVEMPYSDFRDLLSHIERFSELKNPTVQPQASPSPAGKYLSHPEQCIPRRRCIPEPATPPLEHTSDEPLHISKFPSQFPENRPAIRKFSAPASLVPNTSPHGRDLLPEEKPCRRLKPPRSTSKPV